MNHTINDSFMNPDRFGYAVMPFKLDGDKVARKDIPIWRIRRTAYPVVWVKECMNTLSLVNAVHFYARVYNNECFDCWN